MTRRVRLYLVWLLLFALYAVPVLVFEPFTALGVPVWLSVIIGAVIGLVLRIVAEVIVTWREEKRSTDLYRAEIERLEAELRNRGERDA